MNFYTALLATLLIFFAAMPAHAFGLAMHGEPKYSNESTHLEYANPDAPKGGTLKMAANGTFDTLNPFALQGTAAQGLNLIYDRLSVRVWDEPFTLYPLIAKTLEMPEDRSSLTITLDEHAVFQDGTPITLDDVQFTFETLRDHGRPNMRRVYKLVERVERPSDNSLTFHFGKGFDQETGMILAMMPVLSKTYWQDKDFGKTSLDIPNTNGPYRITSIDPGRSITYRRNPDYWAAEYFTSKGHYNFDTITYDYFRDETVSLEGFTAGEYDLRREYDLAKWMTSYKSETITKDAAPHQRPERARGLIFNLRRAPFNDMKVREALSLLLDYDWINENLFYGQYTPINSVYPNSELAAGATDKPARSPREKLRQADQLLKEAGWTVENGKRMKDGQEFTFEILLGSREEEKIVLQLQRALERLGITMSVRVMDSAAFLDRLRAYDYDMVAYYWLSSLSPGTEQMVYWGCKAAAEPGYFNYSGICREDVDALASSIAQTKSREELLNATHALDKILMESHIMIPLFYSGKDYFAYHEGIKRPEHIPLYGAVLETWWRE